MKTIQHFNYVKLGEQIITGFVIAAAIIVGVCTYAFTAAQLFWLDHGEAITERAKSALDVTHRFALNCYQAGRDLRPIVNHYSARLTDSAFYAIAGC